MKKINIENTEFKSCQYANDTTLFLNGPRESIHESWH